MSEHKYDSLLEKYLKQRVPAYRVESSEFKHQYCKTKQNKNL
jgi:hypothetical protein